MSSFLIHLHKCTSHRAGGCCCFLLLHKQAVQARVVRVQSTERHYALREGAAADPFAQKSKGKEGRHCANDTPVNRVSYHMYTHDISSGNSGCFNIYLPARDAPVRVPPDVASPDVALVIVTLSPCLHLAVKKMNAAAKLLLAHTIDDSTFLK